MINYIFLQQMNAETTLAARRAPLNSHTRLRPSLLLLPKQTLMQTSPCHTFQRYYIDCHLH